MPLTPREIVTAAVTFNHPPRVPRNLWWGDWAQKHFPGKPEELLARYPGDIGGVAPVNRPSPCAVEGGYKAGTSVDEWGCEFVKAQEGVCGEVKAPPISDPADWKSVRPPYEILPENKQEARDRINRACDEQDTFVITNCCPRPWERYQFLRGTEGALTDVLMPDEGFSDLIRVIHEFYLCEAELWMSTNVDALYIMDDWGSQQSLLIDPVLWRELFKPLYKDYGDLARAHGKFVFMHSDGYILDIYEDLAQCGVTAVNSQLFCMPLDEVARRAKGKITFWGEIDRQHILNSSNPQDGRDAVRKVADHLYDPAGGVIAQCDFGVGAQYETVAAVFDEWDRVSRENMRACDTAALGIPA
jgi:hypothetical protein